MRHIKTVEVAGRVVASDGRPATHGYVERYTAEAANDELSASANAKGEFSIKGVPRGSYVLSAHQVDENERHMAQQKLEVGPDNIDSVLIAFGKGTRIRGRIMAASTGRNALDRIRIHLESTSEIDAASFAFAQVERDGSFQIPDAVDGSYALRFYGLEQGLVREISPHGSGRRSAERARGGKRFFRRHAGNRAQRSKRATRRHGD
jgi:hypothetical protein